MTLQDEKACGCHQGIINYAASAKLEPPKRKFLCRKAVLFTAVALALLVGFMDDLFIHKAGLHARMLLSPYEEPVDVGGVGPTFVFIMGLEGTGHHYYSKLLGQSPNMKEMKKLGVCSSKGELTDLSAQFFGMGKESTLFNAKKRHKDLLDAGKHYETTVNILKTIRQKFNERQEQEQTIDNESSPMRATNSSSPFHIAINANSCGRKASMISYPNLHGKDRDLQFFNIDVFYNACADAKVNCKHVYIYRDPYDVIKSTTINRIFNDNIYDAIRLYTSALHQIHSQLVSYPERNMGCFGFLDDKGSQLQQDWEQFGKVFGWDSFDSFMDHAKKTTKKNQTPMSEEMRANLIPSSISVLMKAFEDIHHRVKDFCYASLNSIEDQTFSMINPDEDRTGEK